MNYLRTRWELPSHGNVVEEPVLVPEDMPTTEEISSSSEHSPKNDAERYLSYTLTRKGAPRHSSDLDSEDEQDPWMEELLRCETIYIRDRRIIDDDDDKTILFRVAWRKGDWRWVPMDAMRKFWPALVTWTPPEK